MRFAKGHGTGNDFLIFPDPGDTRPLPPALVARICDRRRGLGADGILRAVRAAPGSRDQAAGPAGTSSAAARPAAARPAAADPLTAQWFMDYRNADGSIAEMCGNGIRVFARYLLDHGLAEGPDLVVATRAGLRQVRAEPDGQITVDMGAPAVLGRSAAVIAGRRYEGLEVSLGNPHLACLVDMPVCDVDLSQPPATDPARFPDGANVEIVQARGPGRLEMLVYERGSGATQSCGTGAVAAAVAAQTAAIPVAVGATTAKGTTDVNETSASNGITARNGANGATGGNGAAGRGTGTWMVQVPGGDLTVVLSEGTSLLTGPAVIVAEGELDERWLRDGASAHG